jgi:uncharacterized membrane protein SirB2
MDVAILLTLSVAFITVGVALLLRRAKRRYQRLNAFGVKQYNGYLQKILARWTDALLLGGGICLILLGLSAGLAAMDPRAGWLLPLLIPFGVAWRRKSSDD